MSIGFGIFVVALIVGILSKHVGFALVIGLLGLAIGAAVDSDSDLFND